MSHLVLTGVDVLVAQGFERLKGLRVGLVCNPTSVESTSLRHLGDLLHEADGVTLAALFAPEHGVRGEAQDMDTICQARDPESGVTVHSLYGDSVDSLTPTKESLAGLDLLILDLQDVGTRYYTFAATMALCLKAAAEAGVKVMVLDRPNPLGGEAVEGSIVEPGYESFVGLYPVPVRHGMTMGEIARWYYDKEGLGCELEVVKMEGWHRSMYFEETGLTWIPPSPNMPTVDTAFVYPGMCLIEGTRLSEGRGTTRPFEQCGAPFIDPVRLLARLQDFAKVWGLEGVRLRPCHFRPAFHKHGGKVCGAVFMHVGDRRRFRPWAMGVAYIEAVRDLWPSDLKWRTDTYEFVRDRLAIDLLLGSSAIRGEWAEGRSALQHVKEADDQAEAFAKSRRPYLLY